MTCGLVHWHTHAMTVNPRGSGPGGFVDIPGILAVVKAALDYIIVCL